MERQQTLALPLKKSLRTSNESIFPSLHPFGPFYRQRTLLQKRTSEMLDNEPECFEPVKRVHTVPQPVKSLASSQSKKQELTNNFLNFFQYSQAANQGLGNDLELGLADIWNNIMGASFTENLQTTLMVEIMRQHIELLAQQPSQLTHLGSERNYSLKVKDLKNKFVVSDSSTNDSETDEENQPKGNKEEELHNDVSIIIAPLHQRQWNEVNTVQQVSVEEKTRGGQGCLDENLMLVEPVPVQVVEDDGLMPGFTDKLSSPVVVNETVQAVLPSFGIGSKSEGNKKMLKPIWEAEDEKIGKAETLIDSLKEVLGFEVTNEEKAIKMLRDNGFLVEKCMEIVGKQKTKHKAEFKIKKVSLKKYR